MDRFTVDRSENYPAYIPNEDAIQQDDELGAFCWIGSAVDAFNAYEKIGLTPDEIVAMREELAASKKENALLWSLPQEPTQAEKDANPWEKGSPNA